MSYVRIKVWGAKLIFFIFFIYSVWTYPTFDFPIKLSTALEVTIFVLMFIVGIYMHNIRCERCKVLWYKAGFTAIERPKSIFDMDEKYMHVKKQEMLSMIKIKMKKKCENCGLERF